MKQLICVCVFVVLSLLATNCSFAQGVSVNTTGSVPDGSAMLDLASTSKGVLVPRMTGAQKWAISSPATGLMIFQTDSTAGFYYYTGSIWAAMGGGMPAGSAGDMLYNNGSSWVSLAAGTSGQVLTLSGSTPTWTTISSGPVTIGMSYGGGIVAYLLQPGDAGYSSSVTHGLIAATSDQSSGIVWASVSSVSTGATGTAIGTGAANTAAIIATLGAGSYAASICDSYTGGGFSDWYLPSKDELIELYNNKATIGGFSSSGYYWTSTQYNTNYAWDIRITDGFPWYDSFSTFLFNVRAIRAF